MILARASQFGLVAAAALAGSAGRADVMEVDGSGARWVAGGVSAPLSDFAGFDSRRADSDSAGEGAVIIGSAPPRSDLAAPYRIPDRGSAPLPATAFSDMTASASAIPARYADAVHDLARRFDLSPALLEAVVWQESRWRADAVSPAGARGLAQLMPGTARYLGVDADDPFANLEGGARYLREQLDRFDGDLEKALAAYNAGPGRVERAGGIPNIRETRAYVAAIMGRLASHTRTGAR